MAANVLFGRVGEFVQERETFRSYVERMEMFFLANNIREETGEGNEDANLAVRERKRAIFLTEIGPEAYSTLSNLLVPAKPRDTPFADIVKALERHYNPAPLEIAESFHFGTRHQKPGEPISDFIVALKKLSIHCNYGEFLNRALRDRFVCGLNNPKIQNKLLNTEDLTFEKACQIAKSMEMAEKNTQEFRPVSASVDSEGIVNKLETVKKLETVNTNEPSCYRCGGKHAAPKCKFKSATCYKCRKIGHIASVCQSKNVDQSRKGKGNVHTLLEPRKECGDDDELGIYSLYAVGTDNPTNKGYTVETTINGALCAMEVDTAADYSIMSKSMYTQKFSNYPLYPSKVELKTCTGETLAVCGEMKCDVVYKGQKYTLPMVIANYENKPTLLGRNWLKHVKLEWGEIFSVTSCESTSAKRQIDDLLAKHSELFEESYEGMKGLEAHITMKDGAKPIFIKPRRVPYALKDEVEKELDKLEKHGVIVKTVALRRRISDETR
ncbi:uncharacterized protein LOC144638095 [Oculina patagonica]